MDTIIFKIDKKLKEKAQKQAQKRGFSLADYYRNATIPLAEGKVNIGIIPEGEEEFNAKTTKEMKQALRDIKKRKNLSPAFDNVEDAINYLKKL